MSPGKTPSDVHQTSQTSLVSKNATDPRRIAAPGSDITKEQEPSHGPNRKISLRRGCGKRHCRKDSQGVRRIHGCHAGLLPNSGKRSDYVSHDAGTRRIETD